MKLPNGEEFGFWEDATEYRKVYHVACGHATAADSNPGSEKRPFRTIGRAAAVLRPGEKAIVHEGVYRERVCPARGGEGPDRMIAYEAAPGETVCIKGSEVWQPAFRPSEGWRMGPVSGGGTVWMADVPAELFAGYNPFSITNAPAEFWTFTREWTEEEAHRFLLRRGAVFADGRPLRQVFRVSELAHTEGAFWVEDPGLRIHLRLWGDADPSDVEFEVTAREQVFAPDERHLGYIRVSGFRMEHAADGIPVPQRALLSTTRGHHWIVEDNQIRWANGCGLDVGAQDWKSDQPERSGWHVIRRNTIADCGICGIAGGTGADHTLVESNIIERVGGLGVERIWECAGLKFHVCTGSLFRGNVFRHLRDACGLWLDVRNRNCRISGNVFADIESVRGGVYIECSHDLNLVDGNVFWDIRSPSERSPAYGVRADSGEHLVVAHNLFGKMPDYAVSLNLEQAERVIYGRVGLCRGNKVLNNAFHACPRRIFLGRAEDNESDGNLFDARDDAVSLCIRYPEPRATLNLAGWQEHYGLDTHSTQARVEVGFDADKLALTWEVEGELPACQPVEAMHEGAGERPPGPFDAAKWKRGRGKGRQRFPMGGK